MALLVDVVSQSITWLRSPEFHSTMLSGDMYMRKEQIHAPPLTSEWTDTLWATPSSDFADKARYENGIDCFTQSPG